MLLSTPVLRVSILAATLALGSAVGANALGAAQPPCSLAIRDVNLVPMDKERVLPAQDVLISNGRILSIKPHADHPARTCTQEIEAAGGYLAPGLNDLHVHIDTLAFAQAFGMAGSPINYAAELALYVANGVTGLRVMSGAPDILAFRNAQRGQNSSYPRLVVASPMLSGEPPVLPEPVTRIVRTPQEARAAVREYARQGYDFIKVRDNLKAPVFRAVIAEARRVGLYVDGHISQGQGLSVFDVLRSGQRGIAHIDNLVLLMEDEARDPETFARLLRACDCFVSTTTQVEANAYAQLTDYDRMAARPELAYVNSVLLRAFWLKPHNPYLSGGANPEFFRDLYARDLRLIKRLHDAGVQIVAGTDALNPMIIPGASLHDELASLVEAGLTPFQALRTATAIPAAHVPGFADTGVLVAGRAANAVLVDANPLLDVGALRSPKAVLINGNWLPRNELDRRLAEAGKWFKAH
jgi:imidazolonepropionase-like amidohydrolase